MIKLCIFDLDGTLLNTLSDLAAAGNYALRVCGFPVHEEEAYKTFVGNGRSRLIRRILPAGSVTEENCARVRAAFDRYYADHSMDQTRPYSGVPEMLLALQERGIALAVWTNKAAEFVKKLMPLYFPNIEFAAICGQIDGVPNKPDAYTGLSIMRGCGAAEDETMLIGDSDVDMLAAAALGCIGVGAKWGFRTSEELTKAGAAHLIDEPDQLLKLIESLN